MDCVRICSGTVLRFIVIRIVLWDMYRYIYMVWETVTPTPLKCFYIRERVTRSTIQSKLILKGFIPQWYHWCFSSICISTEWCRESSFVLRCRMLIAERLLQTHFTPRNEKATSVTRVVLFMQQEFSVHSVANFAQVVMGTELSAVSQSSVRCRSYCISHL